MTPHERETFERATAELSAQFADDPLTELRLWLTLVQRREAALLQTLDEATFLTRVPRRAADGAPRDDLAEALATALRLVSQREAEHVETLDRWRAALELAPDAANFAGRIEGWVVGHTITGRQPWVLKGWLMNASLQAGGTGDRVGRATFAEGCRLWRELEDVAAAGYARLLWLLRRADREHWCEPLGPAVLPKLAALSAVEVPRLLAEEQFHAALLQQVHGWLAEEDAWPPALTLPGAVAAVHALCDRHLAQRDGEGMGDTSAEPARWISDAGLASWLTAQGHEPRPLPVRDSR
jgi:hypothetical protein